MSDIAAKDCVLQHAERELTANEIVTAMEQHRVGTRFSPLDRASDGLVARSWYEHKTLGPKRGAISCCRVVSGKSRRCSVLLGVVSAGIVVASNPSLDHHTRTSGPKMASTHSAVHHAYAQMSDVGDPDG
jgi:hypothetical protein